MRDGFVIIGSLLIAALAALFAVPRFIDWSPYKSEIEARIDAASGLKVTLAGPLRIVLLPQPSLNAQDVIIETPGANVSAARLRVQVAMASLLGGAPHITSAELDGAVVKLSDAAARDPARALSDMLASGGRAVQIDTVALNAVSVERSDGSPLATFERGEAALPARAGPFRVDADGAVGGTEGRLRLLVGTPDAGGKRHVSVAFDANATVRMRGWKLAFDGDTATTNPSPALDGTLTFAQGGLARAKGGVSENADPSQWRVQAKTHVEDRRLRLAELEVARERAEVVRLDGSGELDLTGPPRLIVTLSARRLVLDALDPSARRGAPLGSAFAGLMRSGAAGLPSWLTVQFDISAEAATLAGENFEHLRVKGLATAAGSELTALTARWTGRGDIAFQGSSGGGTVLRGHLDVQSADAAAFLEGLGVKGDSAAPPVPLTMSGDVVREGTHTSVEHLSLGIAGSTVSGSLAVDDPVPGGPTHVEASVAAPELDLDTWPLGAVTGIVPAAVEGHLLVHVDRLKAGRGTGDVGRLDLSVSRQAGRLLLDKLQLQGFDGLTLMGAGALGGAGSSIELHINAPKAAPLAVLARLALPRAAVDAIAARGTAIEPLALTLTARRAVTADTAAAATLSGSAAGTHIEASATLDATLAPMAGSAELSAPDAAVLLRQLGLKPEPGATAGPGSLKLSLKPGTTGMLALVASLSAGQASLSADGSLMPGGQADGHGGFTASAPTLAEAARLLGWALPRLDGDQRADIAGGWTLGADKLSLDRLNGHAFGATLSGTADLGLGNDRRLTGTVQAPMLSIPALVALAIGPLRGPGAGAWPAARFPHFIAPPLPISLRISAAFADLGIDVPARDASLRFDLGERGLAIADATANIAGGTLAGSWRLDRDGALVRSVMRLVPDGIDIKGLLPASGLSGKLFGHLDLAGAGETFAQTVATAGGGGTLKVVDGGVERASPAGLTRVFAKAIADEALMDKMKLAALVLEEVARGPLTGLGFEAPLIASNGVLKTTAPRIALADAATAEGSAIIDLKGLSLDARLGIAIPSPGSPGQSVPLAAALLWKGKLTDPRREADAAALLQAVSVERLRLELARIELMEFDQREQAEFNRRLRAGRQKPQVPSPAPVPVPDGAALDPPATDIPDLAAVSPAARSTLIDPPVSGTMTGLTQAAPAGVPDTTTQLAPLPPPVVVPTPPTPPKRPPPEPAAPLALHPSR